MKNNQMLLSVVLAVVLAGAGFFAGMKYQQSKATAGRQFQGRGQNGQARLNGARPVMGEVTSIDDKSITVKMQDGSSKIVILPDGVTISKTDSGSKADLKQGSMVAVFGTDNSDGSVTAQNVQLNPMFRFGQRSATPSSSSK